MADEDPAYVAWVRRQPCCAPGAPYGCQGAVEPHHDHQGRGLSQRAHDHTCVPLCHGHHRKMEDCAGLFKWVRDRRRAWHDTEAAAHRARYERGISRDPEFVF